MTSFGRDFLYAAQQLRARPGFAAVAILSLALATGATTAIFGLIDAVLLRPLPAIAGQGRLVSVYHAEARKPDSFSPLSWPDYEYYRDHAHALSSLMAYLRLPFRVRIGSRTDSISGELVSPNYFETLGVKARAGRLLSPTSRDTEPVVVISGRLWRERFGASPTAIGKTLFVGGSPLTVIGVAAEDFRGVTLDWGRTPELWIPAAFYRQAEQHLASIDVLHAWGMQSFLTVGRLRDGVSLEQAAQEMRSWGVRADADNPARAEIWGKNGLAWTLRTLPLSQARFWPGQREQILRTTVVLFAVVAGVLLIACANIASLLLTRAAEREREMAARLRGRGEHGAVTADRESGNRSRRRRWRVGRGGYMSACARPLSPPVHHPAVARPDAGSAYAHVYHYADRGMLCGFRFGSSALRSANGSRQRSPLQSVRRGPS